MEISADKNELATGTRRNNDVAPNVERIRLSKVKFKVKSKFPFYMLLIEINQALKINEKVLLTFDEFNAQQNFRDRTKTKTKEL